MSTALVISVLIIAVWFIKAPPEDDVGGIVFHGFVGIPLVIIALLVVWLVYFVVN